MASDWLDFNDGSQTLGSAAEGLGGFISET
jgi:hypothetical protein